MKVIASDLDGTLLNRFHVMDRYILSAVDLALKNNVVFIVATGRNLRYEETVALFRNRPVYQVISNGSIVRTPKGDVLYKKEVDKTFIKEILEKFPNIPFDFIGEHKAMIHTNKQTYLDSFNTEGQVLTRRVLKMVNGFMRSKLFDVDKKTILNEDILKINIRINNEQTKKEFDEFLKQYPNIINSPFSDQIYELTDSSVNKANGVKLICDHLNIDYSEVVSFGDGGNDLELLEEFESYAPKNAIPSAKSKAKHIIGHYYTYAVPRKIKYLVHKRTNLV